MMLPPNTMRLITPVASNSGRAFSFGSFFTNWERFCSQPLWPGVPSLDATIASRYDYCLSRGLGEYAAGVSPKCGEHPSGWEVRCTPQGLEMFGAVNQAFPGLVEALAPRNTAIIANGGKAGLYVGSVPESLFSPGSFTVTKNSRCDALLKPVIAAKFTHLFLDASAACRQDGWKTPTMWLAERAKLKGLTVVIEAVPDVTPGLFPWADGRFANVCSWPEIDDPMGGPGYFGPKCVGCFTERFTWLQGSLSMEDRWRVANERAATTTPIVDFGDAAPALWQR